VCKNKYLNLLIAEKIVLSTQPFSCQDEAFSMTNEYLSYVPSFPSTFSSPTHFLGGVNKPTTPSTMAANHKSYHMA